MLSGTHQEGTSMKTEQLPVVSTAIAVAALMALAHPVAAQPVNQSNLWYGGDEGIEIVTRTGKNLAYTAPRIRRSTR